MRTYLNDTTTGIYSKIPATLRNAIINTTVISSYENGKDTNYTSTDKLYLLSSEEVWGTSFIDQCESSIGTSRQLDYYSSSGAIMIKYLNGTSKAWWLRSAHSNSINHFYNVGTGGNSSEIYANYTYGVAPAFRLG